ncbi:MAG: metal ABC transporter substrate-binding protein [Nitrospiria bacterium]
MKKQVFWLWAVLLLTIPGPAIAKTVRVVTTTEDLAAIARAVGGERVRVDFIARGVQDPHFIDPKPSYILKLTRADLLVAVGLGLEEGWLPPLLTGARNARIRPGGSGYVSASEGISLIDVPSGRIDRASGDVHGAGNPHYWLDPVNGARMAQNILSGLIRVDPEGKQHYEANVRRFREKLDAALEIWSERMRPFQGERVVTYHKSWPYFLKRFGLTAVDYIEPKPGIPPATAHLQQLIERIKTEGVRVIIAEPYFDPKISRFLSEKTGAAVVTLPPSVSEATGIGDYFALFDHLSQSLARAFERPGGS